MGRPLLQCPYWDERHLYSFPLWPSVPSFAGFSPENTAGTNYVRDLIVLTLRYLAQILLHALLRRPAGTSKAKSRANMRQRGRAQMNWYICMCVCFDILNCRLLVVCCRRATNSSAKRGRRKSRNCFQSERSSGEGSPRLCVTRISAHGRLGSPVYFLIFFPVRVYPQT